MDALTERIAVVVLGILSVLCVGGIIWLEGLGRPTPTSLTTLAAAALGAIAGLLSHRLPQPPMSDHRP